MKSVTIVVSVLLLISLLPVQGVSQKNLRRTNDVLVSFSKKVKQGSDLQMWMSNHSALGLQAWDGNPPGDDCNSSSGIGCSYPAGACIEHLYGAGPIVASIINGVRRVTEGYNGNQGMSYFMPDINDTSRPGFWHTSIDSTNHPNKKFFDDDGDGQIDEDELDGTDNDGDWNIANDDVGGNGLPDSLETGCKGGYDPITNPDPAYDNYEPTKYDSCHPDGLGRYPLKRDRNVYTEGNGISDHGEPNVDEDFGALSNNDYYCSYTDTFRTPTYTNHFPQGLKIWQKSYTWNSASTGGAIIVFDYHIVNVGKNTLNDVYIGMFADMDVGPINTGAFYNRNYAGYDTTYRVAYVHNPVDRGSTPLGLTLLGLSKPLDSVKQIFQWSDFDAPCGGTLDSNLYGCMSCEAFGGVNCIKPNQSQYALNDARVWLSNGPFETVLPGDTITMTYAFVAGNTVSELRSRASIAQQLNRSRYFLMSTVWSVDSTDVQALHIYWNKVPKSLHGIVTSYKVYWGTQSGVYTDSLETIERDVRFTYAQLGKTFFIAVKAIDEYGNVSAFSNEINSLPKEPRISFVEGEEISISIKWIPNGNINFAGYNIYRRDTGSVEFVRIDSVFYNQETYVDSNVWGNRVYEYTITAVGHDGTESPNAYIHQGRLKPPAVPSNFYVSTGTNFIRLDWTRNSEGDFRGYNLYRIRSDSLYEDIDYSLMNSEPMTQTYFIDNSIVAGKTYYYDIVAIDTTDAVSYKASVFASTATRDQGILVINSHNTPVANWTLYDTLLRRFKHTSRNEFESSMSQKYGATILGYYSTVLLFVENVNLASSPPLNKVYPLNGYPFGLKGYLQGGGKLFIAGRKISLSNFPQWYQFLSETFGINILAEIDTVKSFHSAAGYQGFPNVNVDTIRDNRYGTHIGEIERFPNALPEQILYTYGSDPYDNFAEGKAVGLRALDTTQKAIYLSFPVYALDSSDAVALMYKVMLEFGEQPLAVPLEGELPRDFVLYQNYPNPFNPTTKIRFDIPETRNVTLTIHDVLGREVSTLLEEDKSPGSYEIVWNATEQANGVYFYRITAVDNITGNVSTVTKKLVLIK